MIRTRPAAGLGTPLLALVLAVQAAIPLLIQTRPAPAIAPSAPLALHAAAVVEPRIGGTPSALTNGAPVEAGSRLQVSFATSLDAWSAVLWFEGDDRIVPLYPTREQQGWTAAETTYAVPGTDAWLRLTPTGETDDLLVVVSALRPDPEVLATLSDPTPARVRSLRARLEERAAQRRPGSAGVERFLPTGDGRVVGVPWNEVSGAGLLVIGWQIAVESSVWQAPSMSSSSAPGSPGRSSPSAS